MNALPTTDVLYPTVTFAATLAILCLLSCIMALTQTLPFTPLKIPFQQQSWFETYLIYSHELNRMFLSIIFERLLETSLSESHTAFGC